MQPDVKCAKFSLNIRDPEAVGSCSVPTFGGNEGCADRTEHMRQESLSRDTNDIHVCGPNVETPRLLRTSSSENAKTWM